MLSWAVKNPNKLAAYAGIYPVQNLRSWPMKRSLVATLRDFEVDEKTFGQMIDQHNPINHLDPLAEVNIPIFIVHGDSDKVVPLEENSGLVRDHYKKLGGEIELEVVTGAGHQVIDAFFKSKKIIEFIIKHS